MAKDLSQIKLLLLDVDGVLTDGRILYDDQGGEQKAFDVKDGHGLKLLQRAGFDVGIITGRQSDIVSRRAEELGIRLVYQGAKDKRIPFGEILDILGLEPQQVAYVGADLVDLPILLNVGFSATVADALDEVKCQVDLVTKRPGGRGAVREICDYLLKATGQWDAVTARYYD